MLIDTVNLKGTNKLPEDYHCDCKYCQKLLGIILDKNGNPYNSRKERKRWYLDEKMHLAKTPLHGIRFLVQNFSKPLDIVFDPTCGSGTTLVESALHGRIGVGIELEFFNVAKTNLMNVEGGGDYWLFQGDALDMSKIIMLARKKEYTFPRKKFQLIINNPPYFGDQREGGKIGKSKQVLKYNDKDNIGKCQGKIWEFKMKRLYKEAVNWLKPKGYFAFGVKDMMRNKHPLKIHIVLCEILENLGLEFVGTILQPHYPRTLFMNTYPKRFPNAKLPLYQTICIFRRKE